jgi:hypothetical protein
MRRLAPVLTAVLGLSAAAPTAQALPVDISYGLSGVISVLGIPLGPAGTGSMAVRYTAASGNSSLMSLLLSPGAPVGLSSGPVHLQGFSFMQVIAFAIGGDTFTGFATAAAGASAPGLLGGGMLSIGPVFGTLMGVVHCVGATCPGLGLPISIPVPISASLLIPLAAGVGTAPSIALSFPIAPFTVGTFGGFALTAMLSAAEVSRHVTPEPGSAALVGLGLVGLASASGWRRTRRARKA